MMRRQLELFGTPRDERTLLLFRQTDSRLFTRHYQLVTSTRYCQLVSCVERSSPG
jgi:hypothetical protein